MKNIFFCFFFLTVAFLNTYSQTWDKVEKRIQAGKNYLEEKGNEVDPQYEILKSFFQRKFSLNSTPVNENLIKGSFFNK